MGWESDWFLFGLILLKVLMKVDFFVYVFEVFLETATTSPKTKKKTHSRKVDDQRFKFGQFDHRLVSFVDCSFILELRSKWWVLLDSSANDILY